MKQVLVVKSGSPDLPAVATADFDQEWMILRLELHIDPATSMRYIRETLNVIGTTWKVRPA